MDLELHQIALVLDSGDVCGEQLVKMTAQVAEVACQKAQILNFLRQRTVRVERRFQLNDGKA